MKQETPLMKQYNSIKRKYSDAMLLFRVGDFYETFGEDAVKCAKILGIVLTKRANGSASHIELAGFPHHALDTYLPKLIRSGLRVAICDQLEDPKEVKGIVKRGVTELVTPGVALNDKVLQSKANNFLAAMHFGKKEIGIVFLDVSTGEFLVAQGDEAYVRKLVNGFSPSEIIYQKQHKKAYENLFHDRFYTFALEDWAFQLTYAIEKLTTHFHTQGLKGFGIEDMPMGIIAAGAALTYLAETMHNEMHHISHLTRIDQDHFVWMDSFTIRNLELLYSPNEQAVTLLDVIDKTCSPMGGRMLKRWLALPSKKIEEIKHRQAVVTQFLHQEEKRMQLLELIQQVADIERLVSKLATARITPREVIVLGQSLQMIRELKNILQQWDDQDIKQLLVPLPELNELEQMIDQTVHPEASHHIVKGNAIIQGFDSTLDELREVQTSSKEHLENMRVQEAEKTGITSLKIAFNNVFGYYIEVRNTHKDKVPMHWLRKQTLVNAERYITEELKAYETKILGAEEKIMQIEMQLFAHLLQKMSSYIKKLQQAASIISKMDCLLSFAVLAKDNQYTRPEIHEQYDLYIKEGRHPVIEKQLLLGESYIANDISLDPKTQQIMMITGPNMSGKSAILRQTALIVLMAQIGSYVPAQRASIGIVDKIFTRVGASDNISLGESTFMVEMNETASILNNLSQRSLILLDEIGRGTSTYDGISIAWAIAEYLHQHKTCAKTLFATHYHELNEMATSFERIQNYNVSIKETQGEVVFLRKLVRGGSNHSFGIHVAKMAGMPQAVVRRAEEILEDLEESPNRNGLKNKTRRVTEDNIQLSFFQLDDPILEHIRTQIHQTDINTLTPVEALLKLNGIKKMIGE